jgi:hypothetical protein
MPLQALYHKKAEEAGGSSNFAADLANAIAAVDLTDVMEENTPFRKVEEQVDMPLSSFYSQINLPVRPPAVQYLADAK